jgi:hypothetical protein
MIRKGGANNNTPDSFKVSIFCPSEQVLAEIEKRDVIRAILKTCPNKDFKALADTLAVDIIKSNLARTKKFPEGDFSGDLAKKIGVRV